MKIKNTIYLDHQATTPVDQRVLAEMLPYFRESFGNPHSSEHALGWQASRAVDEAAARIGQLIGADADEILFTSGATEANNLALLGLARRAASSKRHRALVSATEHKSVLAVGRALEAFHGFKFERLPVNGEGFMDAPTLEGALDEDVLFVSIMAVNNEIGAIQNIADLSKMAKNYGAVFHCDAAQAPGAMALEAFAEHVDMLSLSAHKMYGPKGVGVAYIARELRARIEPVIYGGGQQGNLRSGTIPVPLCVGMGAAAELLCGDTAQEERETIRCRRDRFFQGLKALPWPIGLNGPGGVRRHPGNANIRFAGFVAHDILGALQPHIAASTGSACTSGMPEPSYVLRAIGLPEEEAESSIRFSIGRETTDEDVSEALDLIEAALSRLSSEGLGPVAVSGG